MDGLKSVLLYGGSAGVGFAIDREVTIPQITGNQTYDSLIDIGVGLLAIVIGLHIEHEAGKVLAFGGAGYTASAVLNLAGI